MSKCVLVGVLGCLLVVGPQDAVPAQRVTLEADGMPLEEALRELARQTGFEFSAMGMFTTRDEPAKVTGSFRDAPLKRVLEAICEQTGRSYRRDFQSRFTISTRPEKAAETPFVEVEGGYRIRVRSLFFALGKQDFRAARKPGEAGFEADPRMTVELDVDAPEDDAGARVSGLGETLKVTDSTGRELPPCDVSALGRVSIFLHTLSDPSDIYAKLDVAFPSPEAKSMTVSGQLVLWRKCDRVEVEVPWGQEGAVGQAHGITLIVGGQTAGPDGKPTTTLSVDQPIPKLELGAPGMRTEPSENRVFARWPDGTVRPLSAFIGLVRGRGVFTVTWPPGPEPAPQTLTYSTYVKDDPTLVVPFTIENIPLPDFPQWAEPLAEKAAAEPARPRPKHAYWADGDARGAIEFDVQVDDQPLPGPLEIQVAMMEQKDALPVGEYAQWDEVIDTDGHVRVANLRPGSYEFHIHSYSMGGRGVQMAERLAQHFGIEPKRYTWINARASVDIEAGKTVRLEPVRFVPTITTIRPDEDAVIAEEELVFAWEAYPGAASYRASLGVRTGDDGVIFWASDETAETSVRYDPTKGSLYSESYRDYLDLKPNTQYYWWVTALDANGKTASQGHGGGYFQVK